MFNIFKRHSANLLSNDLPSTAALPNIAISRMKTSSIAVTAFVALACLAISAVAAPAAKLAAKTGGHLATVEDIADTLSARDLFIRIGKMDPLNHATTEEKIAAGKKAGFEYVSEKGGSCWHCCGACLTWAQCSAVSYAVTLSA
jgi:hypothetical protein